MSIVYDFADIAARMNCKKPDERPVVFTGVECGSTGMARLSHADLPPYTPSVLLCSVDLPGLLGAPNRPNG